MEGIQLSVERTGVRDRISIIKVGGYIDTTTSAELEHALSSLLKAGSYDIIVDLGNVDYVSSAGWGIFISEIKGIREKGGDLKLVRMIQEVYEVFELLEFHYILKAFDTLEEAIRDFERTRPATLVEDVKEVESEISTPTPDAISSQTKEPQELETFSGANLEENIHTIISESPDIGTIQIARMLNTSRFGYSRIGWFQLRKILKKLHLNTKKKREMYSKQVAAGTE